MYPKERKVINKLEEQLKDNRYFLYLSKDEHDIYGKVLKEIAEIVLEEPQTVMDSFIYSIAPHRQLTYKGHPIKCLK